MGRVKAKLQRFAEAFRPRPIIVRESATHPDIKLDSDDKYIGVASSMHRAAQQSSLALQRSPLAKRIITLDVDYVIGERLPITATVPEDAPRSEEITAEIKDWRRRYNLTTPWFQKLWKKYLTEGEVGIKFLQNERPIIISTQGLKQLQDSTTGDVVALELPLTAGKQGRLRVVNSLAEAEGEYVGDVLYFRHDENEKGRGVPELLPLLNRLIWEDDVTRGAVRRIKALGRWFWQVMMKGATEQQLKELEEKTSSAPPTASIRYTNDLTEWKAITPTFGQYETAAFMRSFRAGITGGAGQPSHWHGDGGDVNFATAKAMTEPALKQMGRFQGEFRGIVETLLDYVTKIFAEEKRVGHIKAPVTWDITLPDLTQASWEEASNALSRGTLAVDAMVTGEYITHRAGQRILREVAQKVLDITLSDDDMPEIPKHGAGYPNGGE